MKKVLFLLLLTLIITSNTLPTHAGRGRDDRGSSEKEITFDEMFAIDCNFAYNLEETKLERYSLPDLSFGGSVNLPEEMKAIDIIISGSCTDPKQTLLVAAKKRGSDGGKFVLTYTTDLQLVTSIKIEDLEEAFDDDDDNDDDNDFDDENSNGDDN